MVSADGEGAIPRPGGKGEERILVSVRMRPLNEKEASRNEVVDWERINNTTIIYKNHLSPERSLYPTSYTFGESSPPPNPINLCSGQHLGFSMGQSYGKHHTPAWIFCP